MNQASLLTDSNQGSNAGALARRRGRNVLMLNELVLDLEVVQPCRGSPSAEMISSLGMLAGGAARCTPCTQQLTSFTSPNVTLGFTPPNATLGSLQQGTKSCEGMLATGAPAVFNTHQQSLAADSLANQKAAQSMWRTSPSKISSDASQRKPACGGRLGGAAAASGDASQRNPLGRVSLGVAVIGGDASQRSPPGCSNKVGESGFGSARAAPMMMQQTPLQRPVLDHGILSSIPHGITGTQPNVSSPASSCSSTSQDASQRTPAGHSMASMGTGASNETLKSWLAGTGASGLQISDSDLAEALRAAAPETYED